MLYALVQKTLDQSIDRKALEEASVHAPSVARADCARLSNQLFGVVVTALPHNEAIAFQTALEHFGFSTEVVAQEELPLLTPPKFRRGIRIQGDIFNAIDGLGREDGHSWNEVQFAAGGFIATTKIGSENSFGWNYRLGGRGNVEKTVRVVKRAKDVKEREFRLEFFLSREPWRLQFRAGQETVFRYNDAFLRFRQQEQFLALLQQVAGLLPPGCLSLGVLAATRGESFTYPSIPAFEEEITWHLLQRLRQ